MGKFGIECKKIFEQYHLKYSVVAAAVNYDASYVSKWIKGDVIPALTSAQEICASIAALAADSSVQNGENDEGANRNALYGCIYDSLYQAYLQDARVRDRKEKTVEVLTESDRKNIVIDDLDDLRKKQKDIHLKILGDLTNCAIEELIFLMDMMNHVQELGFTEGEIYIIIPEQSAKKPVDEFALISFLNLIMISTHIPVRVFYAPILQQGLTVLADNFLYMAQCWCSKEWIFEHICHDTAEAVKLARKIEKEMLPFSREIFTSHESADIYDSGNSAKSFWGKYDRLLVGMLGTFLATGNLLQQLVRNLSEQTAKACRHQNDALIRALQAGVSVRIIIYRDALDHLVYNGTVYVGSHVIHMLETGRLLYIQGLAELLDRYPNLQIQVIDGYVIREIKHRPLPNVYYGKGFCGFLTFPLQDEFKICTVKSSGFRYMLEQTFEKLWNSEKINLIDLRVIIEEYLDFCQEALL